MQQANGLISHPPTRICTIGTDLFVVIFAVRSGTSRFSLQAELEGVLLISEASTNTGVLPAEASPQVRELVLFFQIESGPSFASTGGMQSLLLQRESLQRSFFGRHTVVVFTNPTVEDAAGSVAILQFWQKRPPTLLL